MYSILELHLQTSLRYLEYFLRGNIQYLTYANNSWEELEANTRNDLDQITYHILNRVIKN